MKVYKLLLICLLAGSPLLSLAETSFKTDPDRELVFLNWSEYMDPQVLAEFERKHRVTVRQVYFETDDTRDDLLLETGGRGYDLVLSSGLALDTYKKQGWLAPVERQQVPNLKHINKRWIDAFPAARGYAVPYFWGTTGIAYRRDLLGYDIDSWTQLFQPDDRLSGEILMAKAVNDVLSMALKSLGFSANSTRPEEYRQVEQLLLQQKKHVKQYGYMALNEQSVLVTGKAYAAMAYSGDALTVKDIEPRIQYVLPKEGGNIWVDYITVMAASDNKQLAYQFINFLNQPEIAARLAQFVYYASPNLAAEKLLDADFLSDPIIYPDQDALQRSEFNRELPPRIVRTRNHIFNKLIR